MLPPWLGGGLADGETKGPGEELPDIDNQPETEGDAEEVNPFYGNLYSLYSSSKDNKDKTMDDISELEKKFSGKVNKLKQQVEAYEKPDGSKDYPARTCNDIYAFNPKAESGMYFIDPNQGCKDDAIRVHCDFQTTEDGDVKIKTCVSPKKTMSIEKDNWQNKLSTRAQRWFVEDHQHEELSYNADKSQLTYLGYLSALATQDVTVHCKKSIAWFDQQNKNYKKALKFMGTEEQEFAYSSEKSRMSPEVLKDECSYMSAAWKTTELRFTSKKFIRLPIVDVAPLASDETDAMFGVQLGPVCFM